MKDASSRTLLASSQHPILTTFLWARCYCSISLKRKEKLRGFIKLFKLRALKWQNLASSPHLLDIQGHGLRWTPCCIFLPPTLGSFLISLLYVHHVPASPINTRARQDSIHRPPHLTNLSWETSAISGSKYLPANDSHILIYKDTE